LNPILGWSKILQTKALPAAKVTEALKVIERNAQLQVELIDDLLDVSRILRGKLSLNSHPVDLISTIQAAIETVRLPAEAKLVQIETHYAVSAAQVLGESSRLQQIIWNLLSNAVKFTPEGGKVSIQLERVGSQAELSVSDTGKGIAPDFLPHVFDYFRQADATTTRQFGGLGLGLAIAHHLAELHGGTIQAASSGEGQGATFTLQLPLLSNPSPLNQYDSLVVQSFRLDSIKVLLVDDDTDARDFVAFLLEQEGAAVLAQASAADALAILASFQPDILLSDIGMPGMDGYALIQQVRSLSLNQGGRVPAIALTAYAGKHDQQQALKAGFQKHIPKPIEPHALIQAISELVHLKVKV
ncbi:MAG TPA: ATP-binding protein, partial [Trichocoleus sp.]